MMEEREPSAYVNNTIQNTLVYGEFLLINNWGYYHLVEGPPGTTKHTPMNTTSIALVEYMTNPTPPILTENLSFVLFYTIPSLTLDIWYAYSLWIAVTFTDYARTYFEVSKAALMSSRNRSHSWSNSGGKKLFVRLLQTIGPPYGLWA